MNRISINFNKCTKPKLNSTENNQISEEEKQTTGGYSTVYIYNSLRGHANIGEGAVHIGPL